MMNMREQLQKYITDFEKFEKYENCVGRVTEFNTFLEEFWTIIRSVVADVPMSKIVYTESEIIEKNLDSSLHVAYMHSICLWIYGIYKKMNFRKV